jgi:hypothetical protein
MAVNSAALKRGWHYDKANSKLSVYVDGVEAAYFTSTAAVIQPTGTISFTFSAPTTSTNTASFSVTSGSATPGTVRALVGSVTSYSVAMTSGNLVGVRGEANLAANLSGGYVYGAQGKIIAGANTIAIGSGMAYAVMGQLDLSGTTITNGYVAGIGSDIFGVGSGTVNADLFYGQHAGGGTIQSYFNAFGRATYAFILNSNTGGTAIVATGGTYSTADGYLACYINGAAMRIPYFAGAD